MRRYHCHKISEGKAEGSCIISEDRVMFYLIDPETGTVLEPGHQLQGKVISNQIMIFPGGKGSSVVQADGLFQLNMHGNIPAAMVIRYPETVLISSAIIMGIPMVDCVDPQFYKDISEGDLVRVNADEGYIEVFGGEDNYESDKESGEENISARSQVDRNSDGNHRSR